MNRRIADDTSPANEPGHVGERSSDRIDEDFVVQTSDGIKLAGTLVRPPKPPGRVPAVLILNGSGPLDRNSNFPGQILDVAPAFAERFAGAGIASLRFDKRGVAESEGDFATTGLDLEISDAIACLATLRSCDVIHTDRVAVIGHSVGATIAMHLAARVEQVAAAVLLAGPAVPGLRVLEWQTARIATSLPGPDWLLPAHYRRRAGKARKAILAPAGQPTSSQPGGVPANWMRDFAAHDPAHDLRAIECPVLAVTGRKDLQVDADDVARMATMVRGPFTADTPDNLTHLLRNESGPGGLLTMSRQLRRPVDAYLLDRVTSWLAGQLAD